MTRVPAGHVDARVYPSIAIGEPGKLARGLVRYAEASGYAKRLYAIEGRTHIRAGAWREIGTWWIAPTPRRAVHRCGTIVVTSRYRGAAGRRGVAAPLFAGLCVQRGLDTRVPHPAAVNRSERGQAMTGSPRGIWEDFLPEMAAGYIDPLAGMAEVFGGCPLAVILDARDPRAGDGVETIAFEWSRGEMVPLSAPHRLGRGHLRAFASAGTLATLARRLRYAPQCRGLWVELAIGFQLWVDRRGPATVAWDERRIWESACRPWSLWLR